MTEGHKRGRPLGYFEQCDFTVCVQDLTTVSLSKKTKSSSVLQTISAVTESSRIYLFHNQDDVSFSIYFSEN